MTRTKVLLLVSFAVVFATGFAVGRLTRHKFGRPGRQSWLAGELELTPEQREQMEAIWSDVMGRLHKAHEQERRALYGQRQEAIENLLTPEQLTEYLAIVDRHEERMRALAQERWQAVQEGVERTKEILTEEQARRYEEMMERMKGRMEGPRRDHDFPAREGRAEPAL